MIRLCVLTYFLLSIGGCSIAFPQASATSTFFKALSVDRVEVNSSSPARWLASVNNRGAVLTPYATSGLTVFASDDGDAIAFDGWIVRSIVGFGLSQPVSILGREGARELKIEGKSSFTYCGPWILEGTKWKQMCSIGSGEIVLDENDQIQEISMSLGDSLGVVVLQIAK